jgi:phosphatidate phosphatase APP1
MEIIQVDLIVGFGPIKSLLDNIVIARYNKGERRSLTMADEQVSPIKKARRKYEQVHKDERKTSTGQFNTRLPREDFEEINAFLRENGIPKIALIYAGYHTLQEEVAKQKAQEADNGV